MRFLKNLFVDFLISVSGTYIGAPKDKSFKKPKKKNA